MAETDPRFRLAFSRSDNYGAIVEHASAAILRRSISEQGLKLSWVGVSDFQEFFKNNLKAVRIPLGS